MNSRVHELQQHRLHGRRHDNGTSSKLDCAKEGIRSLISNLWPCDPSLATCPIPNTDPLDKVGLEIFPGLNNGAFAPEFDCSWTLGFGDEGYTNSSGYDVVPLSSDFEGDRTTGGPRRNIPARRGHVLVELQPGDVATRERSRFQRRHPWNQSKYGAEAPNCPVGLHVLRRRARQRGSSRSTTTSRTTWSTTRPAHAKGVIILLSDGDANTRGGQRLSRRRQRRRTRPPSRRINDWVFSIGYDTPATGCSTDTGGDQQRGRDRSTSRPRPASSQ